MQRDAARDDVCQLQLMAELMSAVIDTGIRVLIREATARRGVAAGNLPSFGTRISEIKDTFTRCQTERLSVCVIATAAPASACVRRALLIQPPHET